MSRVPGRKPSLSADKIFLCVLAGVYVVYLAAFGNFLYTSVFAPSGEIAEHAVNANPADVVKYWTVSSMRNAVDIDQQSSVVSDLKQENVRTVANQGGRQEGKQPSGGDVVYPLSTVGKVFFTTSSGQNAVCSGTAVVSANRSVVDTAGHCLYLYGDWTRNFIFCPQYDNGSTPYGCWAARELEVPSDWINAKPNDYHHDFGMAIVAPNDAGYLTDVVGGAGWAYNQSVDYRFYAYGYPAAYPFDGKTRKSCEDAAGTTWQHGGGTVVSIPCNMTGGSSGGPWFVQINGNWYLNGHNDFINYGYPGNMFSPYYDDTWHDMYVKAQDA